MKLFFALLLIGGCGYFKKHEPKTHDNPIDDVRAMQALIYPDVEYSLAGS